MDFSNRIDTQRRTAVYVRISTSMQKTDRQIEELVTFAKENKLNFNEKKDIYRDVISGFKDGEQRPMFSALMEKVRRGEYQQVPLPVSALASALPLEQGTIGPDHWHRPNPFRPLCPPVDGVDNGGQVDKGGQGFSFF